MGDRLSLLPQLLSYGDSQKLTRKQEIVQKLVFLESLSNELKEDWVTDGFFEFCSGELGGHVDTGHSGRRGTGRDFLRDVNWFESGRS